MIFTEASIEELISCPKRIKDPPSKSFREENRHRRKDMCLESLRDPGETFDVFIRQSLEFPEDFSVGLIYRMPDGKRLTLVRYNGQHDQANDPLDLAKPHFQYHIHTATAENLNNEQHHKHPAEITPHYASFEEAIGMFLTRISLEVAEATEHFPHLQQLSFFQTQGDDNDELR
jgi:hypothetical protein